MSNHFKLLNLFNFNHSGISGSHENLEMFFYVFFKITRVPISGVKACNWRLANRTSDATLSLVTFQTIVLN